MRHNYRRTIKCHLWSDKKCHSIPWGNSAPLSTSSITLYLLKNKEFLWLPSQFGEVATYVHIHKDRSTKTTVLGKYLGEGTSQGEQPCCSLNVIKPNS